MKKGAIIVALVLLLLYFLRRTSEKPSTIMSTNLDQDQNKNAYYLLEAMKAAGIKNNYTQAAILGMVLQESGLIPKSERSYSGTSNSRIRDIFTKTRKLSESQLTELKKSPLNFFNYVYGGREGNAENEGYKYRGRGYNQITFKNNYYLVSKLTGIDFVTHPEQMNEPGPAAAALVAFIAKTQEDYKKSGKWPFKYDLVTAPNLEEAAKVVCKIERGSTYSASNGYYKNVLKNAETFLSSLV